jgi:hypothetical protein
MCCSMECHNIKWSIISTDELQYMLKKSSHGLFQGYCNMFWSSNLLFVTFYIDVSLFYFTTRSIKSHCTIPLLD